MKPNPFPPAAVAAFAAGLDEYRLITPYEQQTSQGGAEYAASSLLSSGWAVHIPRQNRRVGIRVPCPVCTTAQLLNSDGQIRRHGAPGRRCHGSGAIPHRRAA